MKKRSREVLDQLHEDWGLLELYFKQENWDLLDSKLQEIIESRNFNRLRGVLVLFKAFKEDPRFKHVLEKIKNICEEELGCKLH